MNKLKLLVVQESLMNYRVAVWNILADRYDLTIAYCGKGLSDTVSVRFNLVRLQKKEIGPFFWLKGLNEMANKYDVVCITPDPHVLNFLIMPHQNLKCRLITWSIGFRCSYTHPYVVGSKHTLVDNLLYRTIFRNVEANIFYMEKAKTFWSDKDLNHDRIFVAPNTTAVEPIKIEEQKKTNILFVGSLYKGKGLDLLLSSFKKAITKTKSVSKLIIIGKGEMREQLESYVAHNELGEYVEFTGAVYDEKILAEYFSTALLCVSPTQGGLSCPKSMGYGVPFVCRKDAITGGEIYHMTPGVDGIMYDKDEDLEEILVDAIEHPSKYVEMGRKAKDYYDNNATPLHMANGAIRAIECAMSKNIEC